MRLILYTGLLMLPLVNLAQETEGEALLLQQLNGGQDVITVPDLKQTAWDRIDFGLQLGSAFTSFGGRGSLFSSYVAPEIRYQATARFHFSAGAILSTGFSPGTGLERITGPMGPSGNHFNRILIYAEGNYRINQRLTLGGTVVKELDNDFARQMNAFHKNTGFQSMGMSVHYKITDHFHIGARLNVSEGRPYYYTDPTNPFLRRSPFHPLW